MDIVELVRTRYTTKHYDPARRISDKDIARADAHSRLRKAENRKNFGLSFAFYSGVC